MHTLFFFESCASIFCCSYCHPGPAKLEPIKEFNVILSAETGIDGNILTFKMNFKKEWEGSLKEVNMLTRVIPAGGTIVENEGHLEVREAKKILLVTMVQPDFKRNGIPFSELYPKLNNSETEFKRLLSDHVAIHGEMFNRVEFMLDDEVAGTQTSEELIAENPLGTVSNAMMQRLFYASRYGSISSSGEYPPNLKGRWGTKWRAGWSGDPGGSGRGGGVKTEILSIGISSTLETRRAVARV